MTGGNSTYLEKAFPNRKVGHVITYDRTLHLNDNKKDTSLWVASLDGVTCGVRNNKEDAMHLVDMKYKEKYGE